MTNKEAIQKASWAYIAGAGKAGKGYAIKPSDGSGDFTFSRPDGVNQTGVKNAIDPSGRLVSYPPNVPAVQFENGVNKGLWIEPSATNIQTFSEDFTNPIYGKVAVSVTGNNSIAPDGTTTADKLIATAVNSQHRLDTTSTSSASVHTFSVYAKQAELFSIQLRFQSSGVDVDAFFDLQNGIKSGESDGTTANIEFVGKGWYRCSITGTAIANSICRINVVQGTNTGTFLGDGTSGIFIWGAQLETGSVATSYIKTEGSTVTRPADIATITDASDLIGQEQGTVLVEVDYRRVLTGFARRVIQLGTTGLLINIRSNVENNIEVGWFGEGNFSTFNGFPQSGRYKMGVVYNGLSIRTFINGVIVNTRTASTPVPSMNTINIGCNVGGINQLNDTISQAIIFKQALTDTEVQNWTTL